MQVVDKTTRWGAIPPAKPAEGSAAAASAGAAAGEKRKSPELNGAGAGAGGDSEKEEDTVNGKGDAAETKLGEKEEEGATAMHVDDRAKSPVKTESTGDGALAVKSEPGGAAAAVQSGGAAAAAAAGAGAEAGVGAAEVEPMSKKRRQSLAMKTDAEFVEELAGLAAECAAKDTSLPSTCCYMFRGCIDTLTSAKVSADGRLLAGCFSDSSVRVWDTLSASRCSSGGADDQESGGLPERKSLAGGAVEEWAPAKPTVLRGHCAAVYDCDFSADRRFLVTCVRHSPRLRLVFSAVHLRCVERFSLPFAASIRCRSLPFHSLKRRCEPQGLRRLHRPALVSATRRRTRGVPRARPVVPDLGSRCVCLSPSRGARPPPQPSNHHQRADITSLARVARSIRTGRPVLRHGKTLPLPCVFPLPSRLRQRLPLRCCRHRATRPHGYGRSSTRPTARCGCSPATSPTSTTLGSTRTATTSGRSRWTSPSECGTYGQRRPPAATVLSLGFSPSCPCLPLPSP